MRGELLALLAAILWGIAPLLDKAVMSSNVSPYMANVVRTVGSMVFLTLATLYMKEFNSTHLTTKNIAYLLLAGIIAGGFAMVVYFKALKLTQASKVVPITSIYPLITVVFSAILLGEDINPKVVIGAILIVLGVMLVSEG